MDSNISKIYCPEINLNSLENLGLSTIIYRKNIDTFYLHLKTDCPATSYDLEGILWLRVDIQTGDIIGIQIDDFESVFLNKYPEVAKAWDEAKMFNNKKLSPGEHNPKSSFLLTIINLLKSLLTNYTPQSRAEIVPA